MEGVIFYLRFGCPTTWADPNVETWFPAVA
jgi:hypothetical protein